MRSLIRSRSNCAMDANTWKINRPAGVVVSISSASDRKPASRSSMAFTIFRRSDRNRASRSYFVTVTTSPLRSWPRNYASSGRSRFVPLIVSAKMRPTRRCQGIGLAVQDLIGGRDTCIAKDNSLSCQKPARTQGFRKAGAGALDTAVSRWAVKSVRIHRLEHPNDPPQ